MQARCVTNPVKPFVLWDSESCKVSPELPARKKKALVATAHWLVRCMWAMLRTGEAWREAA